MFVNPEVNIYGKIVNYKLIQTKNSLLNREDHTFEDKIISFVTGISKNKTLKNNAGITSNKTNKTKKNKNVVLDIVDDFSK